MSGSSSRLRQHRTKRLGLEALEQRQLLAITTAVQSGLWSNPAIWSGNAVPSASDTVKIEGPRTITYDLPANTDPTAEAKELLIQNGGKLFFSRQTSTRLDLDGSLTVRAGGTLDVGTTSNPIPAGVTAYIGFNVANDRLFSSNDPADPAFQPGPDPTIPDYHPEDTGLWVMQSGSVATFQGAAKLSWTRLVQDAPAGGNELVLGESPVGWRIGDRIVVTPTQRGAEEVERTIVGVNGNRVLLDEGLTYLHEGSLWAHNTATQVTRRIAAASELASNEVLVPLQAEVGLLTHNVTVASNLVAEGNPNHRAHTVYMLGAGGSIAYAEFRDLGPRGKLGRYPMHFHETASEAGGSGFLVEGASIWNSTSDPGNKFVSIHGTEDVVVRDTVGFNAQGAGFYLENALERGNRLEHNLGVLVYGPEEIPGQPGPVFNYPTTASAVYWAREGNELVDNVAVAGVAGAAGFWVSPNRSDIVGYTTAFTGNEAHGNDTGLYYSGGTALSLTTSDSYLWRNKVGLQATTLPTSAMTQDSLFFGNGIQYPTPFPGSSSRNVFAEDVVAQPWQGFIDNYLALNTNVYTYGAPGTGNVNYYDGDFGDFDGDGLMDRALISRYGLLWNKGGGFMTPVAGKEGIGERSRPNPTGFKFREAPDNTISNLGDDGINFADVDNDGDYDVVSGGNGETFMVQENSRGRFSIKSLDLNNGTSVSAWQIVNTDLEKDGDVDLIVGSGFPFDFSVLVNNGSGNFTEQAAPRGLNLAADPPEGHVSGDVDGDGDYDLLLLDGDNRTTSVIGLIVAKNNGSGFFTRSVTPFSRTFPNLPDIRANGDSNQSMSLGDIDDDGDLDLFMAHGLFFTDHNLRNETIGSDPIVSHSIWINDGNGNFVEESAQRFVGNYNGEILRGDNGELVDVDLDNDLDIVALRRDSDVDIKHFQVFLNDGTGHFTYDAPHSMFFPATIEGFGNDVDMTDLNGDGATDAWIGMAGEQVRILLNTYQDPSGLPVNMPRNVEVVSNAVDGITLSWQAPPFASTARFYKVFRSTSPGLAVIERELIKVVGEKHQDEAFSAPISRWTTTEDLGDLDVALNGARDEIRFTDRTAQPGVRYYYSIVHVGSENTHSRPTKEVEAIRPAVAAPDSTGPFLFIAKPTKDEWSQHPEIVLQYSDGGSGVDLQTLQVSFDKPIGVLQSQTFIPLGSTWKYLDNGSNQLAAWRARVFDDSTWKSGPAKLGYGNSDDATTVSFGPNANNKFATTYFRRAFNVDDVSRLAGDLTIRLKRDDGAIVYVNGSRVGVSNVSSSAAYNTYATSEIADSQENTFVVFSVDRSLLVNGTNVIAVEIHQFNHAAPDLAFDLELIGSISSVTGRPAGSNLADLFVFKNNRLLLAPFEGDMSLPVGPVTMTASLTDNAGNTTTRQKSFNVSVTANQMPSAAISLTQGTNPREVSLSAANSGDSDGTIMRYEWYFPDGTTALGREAKWLAPSSGEHEIELYVWDDRGGVAEAEAEIDIVSSTVVGRHVFYNQSKFDGNDADASANDDAAIASDKIALLPGQTSSFANYTSYNRGLNGLMFDIANLPLDVTLSASDFEFKVGNENTANAWTTLPAIPAVSLRPTPGLPGTFRVTLIWPTGAAIKQWLQVTVKANGNTGLVAPDVFYFGNAVGESGNVVGDYSVSITDELLARNNPVSINPGTLLTNRFDYNRDGTVSVVDQLLARNNITTSALKLKQITVPLLLTPSALLQSMPSLEDAATTGADQLSIEPTPPVGILEKSQPGAGRGSRIALNPRAVAVALASYGEGEQFNLDRLRKLRRTPPGNAIECLVGPTDEGVPSRG